MKKAGKMLSRREFLYTAGTLAAGVGIGSSGAAGENPNAFAYDVERFGKTDPALVHYEEAGRFASPGAEPRRIAVAPDGNVLLACKPGVFVVNTAGQQQLEIDLTGPARCVATAGDGTIYAALRDHVEVFDPKGRRLGAWETPGPKTWFTGLAAGEAGIFAADAGNRVIVHYDKAGKVVKRIGAKNKERNIPGLIVPSPYLDVQLGGDGLLRVNNPGRHCVETYTTDGELEFSWGKPSAAIRGFCGCCNPISVAVLPGGGCVTCEKGLPRVKVYTVEGEFKSVVAGPESFPANARPGATRDLSDGSMGGLDAAVDKAGRIYILDLVAAEVRVMKLKSA